MSEGEFTCVPRADLIAQIERLTAAREEMAAVIRHFMKAPPDEQTVRKRVSFETAEFIYQQQGTQEKS